MRPHEHNKTIMRPHERDKKPSCARMSATKTIMRPHARLERPLPDELATQGDWVLSEAMPERTGEAFR